MVITVVLLALGETGCEYSTPRAFATEGDAERHLSQHLKQFTVLAGLWLSSGHSHLYWYGRSILGRELFTWSDYWVRPNWWTFEVMHWNGHEYIVDNVASLDDAARICGSTRQEILGWHSQLASLSIDMISREIATRDATRFSYVEISFFPVLAPYGFRYAPPSDSVAQRELKDLARQRPRRGIKMSDLGDGWFYFEGLWTGEDLPFKRVR